MSIKQLHIPSQLAFTGLEGHESEACALRILLALVQTTYLKLLNSESKDGQEASSHLYCINIGWRSWQNNKSLSAKKLTKA